MTVKLPLGPEDVALLLVDRSDYQRAKTASKVAQLYTDHPEISSESREIGVDIFRLLVQDSAREVRQSLVAQLKRSTSLPPDIAMSLASDIDEVAMPMLNESMALREEDLLELVKKVSEVGRTAMAKREKVSEPLARSLAQKGEVTTVSALLANPGAEISSTVLEEMVARRDINEDEQVLDAMSLRIKAMPISISSQLKSLVTQHLQDYLVGKNQMNADLIKQLVRESQNTATNSSTNAQKDTNPTDLGESSRAIGTANGAANGSANNATNNAENSNAVGAATASSQSNAARSVEEAESKAAALAAAATVKYHQLPDPPELSIAEFQINQLITTNRLTASYILRTLAIGELVMAEVGLARMARLSVDRIRSLIYDSGQLGFKAVFERARLPAGYFEPIRFVIESINLASTSLDSYELLARHQLIYDRMKQNAKVYNNEDMKYLTKRFELLGVQI